MRWRGILAPLKHSHSGSLSSANLHLRSKASFSTLPRRVSPQTNPSPAQQEPSQEQPRSSSQSLAIAKLGKSPSPHVAEVGNFSSSRAKVPIRSSSKTIAISEDFSGKGTSSQTNNISVAEEKTRSSTSEAVKRPPGRRQALTQVNITPLEASRAKVNASSKPSSAQVSFSGRHGYEANASSSNHTKGGSVDAAKNSIAAVNKRNGEASLSNVKVAGKINYPDDGITFARTTKTGLSQTEGKAKPRYESLLHTTKTDPSQTEGKAKPSYESLLHTKNAMHVSTTQLGERFVGVVPGALNERLGSGSSLAEEDVSVGAEDIIASSTNDTSECMLANGPSEGSATLEDNDQAGSKKSSFAVSFPVTIFSDWWFSCFAQNHRPYYTSLNHPLNKVYVWLAAYQRAHFDVTGHYTDGQSAVVLMKQLLNLQNAVLDGRFRWGDKKLVYLPTPVGHNEEPLADVTSFPSFQDRVVNEMLYLVLEPIFEARFSARSHGFRPGRDSHTALRAAQRSFQGCTWFISGNLNLLHEEIYTTHLVDSALRVVRDTRVTFLLKSGFLGAISEQDRNTLARMFADQGPCSKLRNLLCNVFLDQLDWFMDEQISSVSKREQPTRSSSSLLFKPDRLRVERPRKLEYLRYGTEILVACNGREEAKLVQNIIKSYFKQKFSMDFGNMLIISHISDGVNFLDHIISQKIVHPIVRRRSASNGRVFEKRAHRIRLCIKGSTECCRMYLKEIETPTSFKHIEEMLVVLDNWYHYAENKGKVMQYCKLTLCYLYAKGVIENHKEGLMDCAEQLKEAMHMVVYDQMKPGNPDKANPMQDSFGIPEHEMVLRDHAWLQSKSSMTEIAASFKNTKKVSPQQYMSQVLWQYLGAAYPSNGDNSWEPEFQMQTSSWGQGYMLDTKVEDFVESVG